MEVGRLPIPINIRALLKNNDLMMAFLIVVLVAMMLVPLPTFLVDVLVVINLALSVGVMLLSMYVPRPLEFSVFPSFLLIITLFRLGLNVSASRLILTEGNAGDVINIFGSLVIGGDYVVGIVIFIMLMVIQFAVINSGAGRVAEVAARFTLDAMPGKQLAIDADLNSGNIDEAEAKKRRMEVQQEANFYGAMDGASKFVKGDAIAAIIVIIVNILGGIAIGVLQRGLDVTTALQDYVLVTVGAGLAVQVPALLISTASGIIVTRNTSTDTLGENVIHQLSNMRMLLGATVIVTLIGLVPGMPKLPFFLVAATLGGGTYALWRAERKRKQMEAAAKAAPPPPPPAVETPEQMMNMVVVDPVELEVGYALLPLVDEERADNLLHQVTNIRRQLLTELGFILPVVRIRDNLRLGPQVYRIKIRGEEVARGELYVDRYLAIPGGESDPSIRGVETVEPAFGLPALWITEAEKGRAEMIGYTVVTPLAALSTHLTELLRSHSSDLLSRQMVQEMIAHIRHRTPAAVDGVVPEMLNLGEFQDLLRNLLRERIPLRDLTGILEVVSKHAQVTRDPNILAEAVRQTMALTISNMYRDSDGYVHVFTFSPILEKTLRNSLSSGDGGLNLQIEPDLAQQILRSTGENMEKLAKDGFLPVLLCPRELRLAFRRLTEQAFPALVVLAFSEIAQGTKVKAHGMVEVPINRG
ncbi:MAG: flagellar biosynthesis protein FlhA [Anaerolineae bacterium]|nr:flagellar biosynthesis protein FlhA [Anaerolineae bacterium]